MSKGTPPSVDGSGTESPDTPDTAFAELLDEATRLRSDDADPRSGRWPANDYY